MGKTQAGREAWAFICFVVAPALPPVTTKTAIKDVAYRTFKVGKAFPASRIDEAAQERCGWKVKALIEERARELRLQLPEGHPGRRNTTRACDNDGEYIDRLRATQRVATPDQREALEWAIRRIQHQAL